MKKEVLVQGSTPGALRAASVLADCGVTVHLIDSGPFLGERTSGEEAFLQDTKLLEIIKNPRIQTWTNTEIKDVDWNGENCRVNLIQNPRYIDLDRCTACGACVEICPVTIPGTNLKAIHLGGQPDCAVITKDGLAPCSSACPAGIHVQGYIALIADGRYQEAYDLIHEALPFPSVCGRVCNHYCEGVCSRIKIDEAVNIMALKRFVSDQVMAGEKQNLTMPPQKDLGEKAEAGKRVAIIGAGPAGLTAGRDLVRAGYRAKVFDANPKAGGMMRVGIPPHRLPYDHLEREIQQIITEGVELQLNTWVDDVPALLEEGFDAVLLATGAHRAIKVPLDNADHPDNWLSLDFLKKVCLGEKIDLSGRSVIVLGGGDVAMDTARSAVRLGQPEVKILCRGLRASFNEIQEAEEEGIQIIRSRVFKKIVLEKGKITGVECLEAEVGDVVDGKRQFKELPGTEHLIPGDLVIWAVGQRPDFSFLPEGDRFIRHSSGGIQADLRMMTSLEGVFTAGDVRRGTTFFVVDAVGEGHQAARSIINYLEGLQETLPERGRMQVELSEEEVRERISLREEARMKRSRVQCIPVSERENNFNEVEITFGEDEARKEAARCLSCGPCSECMACVEVCEPGAVIHSQREAAASLELSGIISAAGSLQKNGLACLSPLQGDEPLAGSAAALAFLADIHLPQPDEVKENQMMDDPTKGVGLVICQCNGEISKHIDTSGLGEEALLWPEISRAMEIPSACSPEGAAGIRDLLKDSEINRVIVAACSCCSLDQVCYSCTYQRVRCKGRLGVYTDLDGKGEIEFVNIREGCAYQHIRSRKQATLEARWLIQSALDRVPAGAVQAVDMKWMPPTPLVVGEGKAAAICMETLGQLDVKAVRLQVLSGGIIRTGGEFHTAGPEGEVRGDCLVLAPASGAELDFLTGSVRLGTQTPLLKMGDPESSRQLGIFICPPEMDPVLSGRGGAGEVLAWMGRTAKNSRKPTARVDPLLCRNCGTCLEVCGLGVPSLVEDHFGSHAWINPALCEGCGTCAAHCPTGAIQPGKQTDLELAAVLERIFN